MRFLRAWVLLLGAVWLASALAQPAPPAAGPSAARDDLLPALNERVVYIPKRVGMVTFELQTTLFKPDGEGPFPIALINHGKSLGNSHQQARYRPLVAVRYFLQRGYAVVVPMRQGFAGSDGRYAGSGCNLERNGLLQAQDLRAALDYAVAQPWADRNRIVVIGQSHGGWVTLAFGTQPYPGVRGLINFAGGLRQPPCPTWPQMLAEGAAHYGAQTRLPSLWFYGANDNFFGPEVAQPMFDRYQAAGGAARLVAFGAFSNDAHALFGSRAGAAIWQPEVTKFLHGIGMPADIEPAYAHYGQDGATPVPPRSNYAALDDLSRLPNVRASGRAAYQKFLTLPVPRAFAIAANGAWAWAEGGDDPLKRALDSCEYTGLGGCHLYAVDDMVVWPKEGSEPRKEAKTP